MIQVRKLRGDIQLRAPAIVRPADPFSDPFKLRLEFGRGVGAMALCSVVPALPEVFVFSMEKRGNQIILGSKMAIEAGFGNAGLFHHKVHAHSTHAPAVEEGGCCFEDAFSHIHSSGRRTGHRTLWHSRTSGSDI